MELDLRKQRILQAIVHDYVATAEPVGSQVLVERYTLGVKSATIRSEMAEMSERGYLRQPHTSAGRVPSDRGYRFYVNRLMPLPVIQDGEAVVIRRAVASAASELTTLLRQTCKLLAQMTRLPAIATPPDTGDTVLQQIVVSAVGGDKLLLVLLFSTGHAENRLLTNAGSVSASDSVVLANALGEAFAAKPTAFLRTAHDTPAPPELGESALWARIVREIANAAALMGADAPVVVENGHAVLEYPEFRDVERACLFLATLQERAALLEMLGGVFAGVKEAGGETVKTNERGVFAPVQMVIGGENKRTDWADWAVVSSAYYVGDKEAGKIGVLGPTRIDYARASASVAFMARTMSDLLTRLSASP